ncbi:hypothetical protein JNB63_20195 [Microbacterium trichothecenolyticum]|uniref:Alpha-L-rhamnosidase n=1 Tax=Microbacterium ureisolvens TaxID=2781186 RepID=A0ABS7I6A6_9MICO|nr:MULTISPECIES: alpha-L-rhamnosidase C-terminal domain-containing protein [Microbacterium]MBW9111975.1 hypothetical protein [Microbacterium ureisolvens]MBW9122416.1 hypothetical protein [Microbacterium trichothecenolyticum]
MTTRESSVARDFGAPRAPRMAHLRDDLVQAARSAGADALPDFVAAPAGHTWLYAHGDYQAAALSRVVTEGHATNRFVDYALNFAAPRGRAHFRTTLALDTDDFRLLTTGRATVLVDGHARVEGERGAISAGALRAGCRVDVLVDADGPEPPAVGIRDSPALAQRWETTEDGVAWAEADARDSDDVPPHRRGEAEVVVPMQAVGGGVFALPAPMLGRIVVCADGEPALTTGESIEEALADPAFSESRATLDVACDGEYVSRHQLGFRFARLSGADVHAVTVRAAIRPATHRGAFVTDDRVLNAIWATSAYTLRLCMQTFLIDGIKRDRMPWIGDHALGVLTNAYAFGDASLVRDTLTALGRPRHGYINGISDYSLWWVISQGLYQRFFDDTAHLARECDHIDRFLADLAHHAGADGVFRPSELPDSFAESGPGSLFLDWGVTLKPDGDATAIQILWHWALRSGAEVLAKAGHPGANRWSELAGRTRSALLERAWSRRDLRWREYLDHDGDPTAYPNFLAALSGLAPETAEHHQDGVADIVANTVAGTPFMRAFALLGLGRLGRRPEAVAEVRRLWGRMLDAGALTFWEEFGETGTSPYEMYRRPYGKSLCHAWSAGPAAILPQLVLGLAPLADGWREFSVDPMLGELGWAGAVIPTPHGDLVVHADRARTIVEVPEGTTLVHDTVRHTGPVRVELPTAQVRR